MHQTICKDKKWIINGWLMTDHSLFQSQSPEAKLADETLSDKAVKLKNDNTGKSDFSQMAPREVEIHVNDSSCFSTSFATLF